MALTLAQGAQLVASVGYLNRIRSAMIRAALAVSSETQGALTPNAWLKRRQLATKILVNPDAYVASFHSAVASDPNNSLTWFAPVNISASTSANPIVVTTAVAHNLATGDVVEIQGHLVNTNANGVWLATNITSTTFSVPVSGNGTGLASGTSMEMIIDSDLVFTVNSVFSGVAGLLPGE